MFKKIFIPSILAILVLTAMTIRPTDSTEWTKFKEHKGVEFYQKKVIKETDENKQSFILFKYVNTTDREVNLRWRLNIWIGDQCRSCDLPQGSEYDMELHLEAGETLAGTLEDDDKKLKLRNKILNKDSFRGISKFEFENLE